MSFADTISMWVEDVSSAMDKVIREVVINIGYSIITLTPVETGALKGNWNVTIGSPDTSYNLTTQDPEGYATLGRLTQTANTLTAGQVAYIVNTVYYAEQIEYGYSKLKAPNGMFRISTTPAMFEKVFQEAVAQHKVG